MNAKTNIEAVPTANDRLRAALAERERIGAVSSDLVKKIDRLAPLEAEVAMAHAELQQILQADAEALHTWVSREAKGSPPDVNAKAREDAARKLASARTRLGAATGVKNSIEQELIANNGLLRAHTNVLNAAMVDVIGEEALRSVQRMVKASAAYLEHEANFHFVMNRLRSFASPFGSETQPHDVALSKWLERVIEANRLTNEERTDIAQRVRERTEQELQALLRGEDPVR